MTNTISMNDLDECREDIQIEAGVINGSANNDDPDAINDDTATKYIAHLRWFDAWLDEYGLDITDVTSRKFKLLGSDLNDQYNGSTGLYRMQRIAKFLRETAAEYDGFGDPVPDDPDYSDYGLTRTSEQSLRMGEDDRYAVTQQQVRDMERAMPDIRDQLIIRTLWQTGMRCGELCGLVLGDIDREEREITIRAENAKNDVKRVVVYQPSLDGLLAEWLDGAERARFWPDEPDSNGSHPLLLGDKGSQRGMRKKDVNGVVKTAAERIGIQEVLYPDAQGRDRAKVTAHSLRHGFATHMLHEEQAGIYEVSHILGHSSVEVTENIYAEDTGREGVETVKELGPD